MDSTTDEAPRRFPIGQRRPHKKSKTGCSECRRRRIKCDEKRPRCRTCVRHDTPCLYPGLPLDAAAKSPTRVSGSDRSTTCPRDAPIDASPATTRHSAASPPSDAVEPHLARTLAFSADDMALLHHWTLSTSLSMVRCPEAERCWQSTFPRIAARHPFLMHAILGLTALHLAHAGHAAERSQRRLDAARHHNMALQGFREAIAHISDDNCDALFACSTLNALCTIAMLGRLHDADAGGGATIPNHQKARILGSECIPMIRGVHAVLEPVFERVRHGPLGPLLRLGNWADLDPDRGPFARDERFRGVRDAWAQGPDALVYDEAFRVVRRCHMYAEQRFDAVDNPDTHPEPTSPEQRWGYNGGRASPLLFLHFAPEAYFLRLQQRQPHALVVFAYFGALLHGMDDWFVEGWGRDIVEVADEFLGEYWRPWIRWPREAVGAA